MRHSLVAASRKRTIHNILTPLNEAYQHAIDDGLAIVNPAMNMGRHSSCSESADAHINPLTGAEVRKLLATCQDRYPLLYSAFLCAARTGMRQGELIGLQWRDIDFHGQFIEVRRSVVRRRITTTKTHKIRRVDMSPQLAETLRVLKETRELEASLTSNPMSDWVFIGPTGRRLGNELLRRVLCSCL